MTAPLVRIGQQPYHHDITENDARRMRVWPWLVAAAITTIIIAFA